MTQATVRWLLRGMCVISIAVGVGCGGGGTDPSTPTAPTFMPTPTSTPTTFSLQGDLRVGAVQTQSAHTVQRVIDGDTVVLSSIGTVRLIGVDTPETVDPRKPVEFFGKEASAFTTRLLLGTQVRVEYEQERTDRYQRTLAYLYLPDGTLANQEIIRQGYGHAYLSFPFRLMSSFRAAEQEARDAGRGLWAGATPAASIRVWVNTASGVYHCPGTQYYGTTKVGMYLTQGDAQQKGYRAAHGRECR